MRLALSLIFLVLILLPLSSAQLVFTHDATMPQEVVEGVQRALEEALVDRLDEEGELSAVLEKDEMGEYALSLSYGERQLTYRLLGEASGYEKRLVTALNHDGLSLFASLPDLRLTSFSGRGFGAKVENSPYREGDRFTVFDAREREQGVVVVSEVAEEEGLLLLSQLSGKPLFLGMELRERGNKSVSLSLSLNKDMDPSLDLIHTWPLPMHPYAVQFGLGATAPSRIYGIAGLSAKLPISQLSSARTSLVRSLSLDASVLFSSGYDTSIQEVFYQASGELGVTYALPNWALSLSVGNRVAASNAALLEQGLFLKLTTAYTYTL
ncbi:hypothetical protein [uncultured Sphaerochaeta sp.]|uniref:hypothetical protein n=1 Tax=uncultured Sphaerochaeta sp. TaxID=886478 RepID=UPI002A0A420F|nr:hypothetical protein [uncultured Sphaerochaeta sp.]